ncbi:MAG: hypothetical protein IGS03_01375 [Candidatus Sericytochromatia bacterium]|nr:hypothetical protein [Candidatus Sericytochromatia bacterium]
MLIWPVLLVLGLHSPVWAKNQPHQQTTAKTPQTVFVGIHMNRLVNLDLKQNTYTMDFYLWFRWKGDIDPAESFEFTNAYEKWWETIVSESEAPRDLGNGWKYREFHIEQQFHHPFHFEPYPLDDQVLRLSIEDKSFNSKEIRYLPDTFNSTYNPEIFLPGWKVTRQNIWGEVHKYNTNFGQSDRGNESYVRVNYDLEITRHPRMMHMFKLFLPVAIILVMVFVVFFIPISFFESRVEISITGLLSLIALQMVLNETLPPIGYLTLTDKIYYFAYFTVMCALIETVWVYFSFKRDEHVSRKIDRIASLTMLSVTPIIFALFFTVFKG